MNYIKIALILLTIGAVIALMYFVSDAVVSKLVEVRGTLWSVDAGYGTSTYNYPVVSKIIETILTSKLALTASYVAIATFVIFMINKLS